MHIPYSLFWILLKIYAIFDRDPPFTTSQLKTLIIHEEFELIAWWDIFEIQSTPLDRALEETYLDDTYSKKESMQKNLTEQKYNSQYFKKKRLSVVFIKFCIQHFNLELPFPFLHMPVAKPHYQLHYLPLTQ